ETKTMPLDDGQYSITATVQDSAGNTSPMTPPLVVTIDTAPPTSLQLSLDPSLADPVGGPTYTTSATAKLNGTTDPGATVQLDGSELSATADAQGNFSFTNLPLAVGANSLVARASDLAGNVTTFSLTITRGQLLPPAITAQVAGAPVTRNP